VNATRYAEVDFDGNGQVSRQRDPFFAGDKLDC
jgi:hypothetical protein